MGDIELHSEIGNLRVWHVTECPSTFDVLRTLPLSDGEQLAVFTFNQTAGKGQFNRVWESQPYKNIALSLLIPLTNQMAEKPSLFNMHMSLAAIQAFQKHTTAKLQVKWPNDIYANNCKLAGFLMSIVNLKGKKYFQLGLGINVNQQEWPATVPNACSFYTVNSREAGLDEILKSTLHHLKDNINNFGFLEEAGILDFFNRSLWRFNEPVWYSQSETHREKAILRGVNSNGQVILDNGMSKTAYHLGQVRLLPN